MKLQNLALVLGLTGLGVIINSMAAQALDYNFSFPVTGGQSCGTCNGYVTGEIQGLQDNISNQTPTDIVLYSGNALGAPRAIDTHLPLPEEIETVLKGSISVANGSIQSISGIEARGLYETYLNYNEGIYINQLYDPTTGAYLISESTTPYNASYYNFQAVGVPFDFNPAEGLVLGVPLFMGMQTLKKYKALRIK